MRLEGGDSTFIHDDEDENEEYVDENTAAVEGKKNNEKTHNAIQSGSYTWWTWTWRRRGISNLIQKLGMATNSPGLEYNDDESDFDVAPPVPSIPIHFSR